MQREFGKAIAVLVLCFGISAMVQAIRQTTVGQLLPSVSVTQAVETAGMSVQQKDLSEVTEVFSGLLLTGEEDAISVFTPSEVEKSDADE